MCHLAGLTYLQFRLPRFDTLEAPPSPGGTMIRGVHAMFYSPEADALRTFLKDKVGLPCSDVGEGWLIFDVPEGDVGCHPGDKNTDDISFYTDDIEATVAELKGRGVEFTGAVEDHGYGLVTYFLAPGARRIMLYQPRYEKKGQR
jgi:hypothetical protein